MERAKPRAICCGVPIVWVQCAYWEEEVWEGACVWCQREFAYFDGTTSPRADSSRKPHL